MANPYSTGGGGIHFEARVVAAMLVAVLTEGSVRGLCGNYATAIQSQREAFDSPLDDVIVKGILKDGRQTQLDLQIKNKLTFTKNDKEWIKCLKAAWDTFSKQGFDLTTQRIGVGIGTYNTKVDQHYQSILTWATYSSNGKHFIERIEKKDYSHDDKKSFVNNVRTVLEDYSKRKITDDEIWKFLSSFVIVHFDFQSSNSSRDKEDAIDRVKNLLVESEKNNAKNIWGHLVEKAGELVPAGGEANRATLIQQLNGNDIRIGTAPSFWNDVAMLHEESLRALDDIKSDISGLRLHRRDAYQKARKLLQEGRYIQIDGEPGTGKSALLKSIAEECKRDGPILVLKDMRIQPKGWSAHAHVLGVSTDLKTLLREFACSGNSVLFIDGIDKIIDPAVQLTVNDVLKAIAFDASLANWKVVVTAREQNLRHLETWLDPTVLKNLPLRSIAVSAFDNIEIGIISESFPRLEPLLVQPGSFEVVLRKAFFLDAILRLSGGNGKDMLPATEVELLKLWWELGGSDRMNLSSVQRRRNVFTELAERLLNSKNGVLEVTGLDTDAIEELRSAGIVRDRDLGHTVLFTHDIYEEWTLCQLLIRNRHNLVDFLQDNHETNLLMRPVQLLGTYLLETENSTDEWKRIYESFEAKNLRPVWQRNLLTSCIQSTQTTQLLNSLTDYLLENNGQHLQKMLSSISTIEVLPNTIYLNESITPDIDPPERAKLAHAYAVPKAITWVRFLDWIMPLVKNLPRTLIPKIIPVFSTWQESFAGTNVRHCKEIGDVSYEWLIEIEDKVHPKNTEDMTSFPVDSYDIEKPLRSLFLSSVGSVPEKGKSYLKDKLSDKSRLHVFRNDILKNSAALARYLPCELVDFVLSAFLKKPEDCRKSYSLGYSNSQIENLGLVDHHSFYPASPLNLPFIYLLKSNEVEGLRLIRSICNQTMSFWIWLHQSNFTKNKLTPIPISLDFSWGRQEFWGDGAVYLWFRGTWGNDAIKSALMALEYWALDRCEKGADFQETFQKVVEGNSCVSVLGIALSLCLAYPDKYLECSLPLVTCTHLWDWDINRYVQDASGSHSNVIADWYRYRVYLQAVQRLNEYAHRKEVIKNLPIYFVCSGDEDLIDRYTQAVRKFPEQLPITYQEEKDNKKHIYELKERMTLYSEQADPANFKFEETPEGIKIWNEAPSQSKYLQQQRENEKLNSHLNILLWAQKTLENGEIENRLSIEDVLKQAKDWADNAEFDYSEEELDKKYLVGAIAGTAFVVARHSVDESHLKWCKEIFKKLAKAKRNHGDYIYRGTILSMEPIIFVVFGYAALLERSYEIEACKEALFEFVANPFEGIQSSVYKAADRFASSDPKFYWLLLELGLAQCIVARELVPNYHSVELGKEELEFKKNLLEKTESFAKTDIVPDLPAIPLPWIKDESADNQNGCVDNDTKGYKRNKTVFLSHTASKILFQAPLEPIFSNKIIRTKFLKTLGELVEFTIQSIVPPYVINQRDFDSNKPLEWIFDFSSWCGRVCAYMTSEEVQQVVLNPIFNKDTETALLMMQSITRAFMIEAFLAKEEGISDENMASWVVITNWIFECPEWVNNRTSEFLDREFTHCVFPIFFCVALDFSPLTCVIKPGWPHLGKFSSIIERAVMEFGLNKTLFIAVVRFLKDGGFDLLPTPALDWLKVLVERKKTDQNFWEENGDETVELLSNLVKEKKDDITLETHEKIVYIVDVLTDNGVRGAGFLHQELFRFS